MFGSLGWMEILLIFGIIMLLFGANKLPEIGRGLGKAISNFKKGVREGPSRLESGDEEDEEEKEEDNRRKKKK